MATTKNAMKPGVTLVAKYKGAEYTCEVVEQDGTLRFVLSDGRTFKSPSAAGRADHERRGDRLEDASHRRDYRGAGHYCA